MEDESTFHVMLLLLGTDDVAGAALEGFEGSPRLRFPAERGAKPRGMLMGGRGLMAAALPNGIERKVVDSSSFCCCRGLVIVLLLLVLESDMIVRVILCNTSLVVVVL